jgi:hypothetical protein
MPSLPPGFGPVLAQAPSTPLFPDPDVLATHITTVVQRYNLGPLLTTIGYALLALFALLELYRLWMAQDAGGLPMLGIKILLVNYLIAPASPLKDMILNTYSFFAHLGEGVTANALSVQMQQIINSWAFGGAAPQGSVVWKGLQAFWHWFQGTVSGGGMGYPILFLIYLVAAAISYAVYVFLILMSRLWMELAILVIPILFPLFVWEPTSRSYMGKWVSATVHAILLPLIVGLSFTVAMDVGLLQPFTALNQCVSSTFNPADPASFVPGRCLPAVMESVISGLIGALVLFFFIVGSDRVVTSFVGAAEITTMGIMAARMVGRIAMSAGRGALEAVQAARAGAQTMRETVLESRTQLGEGMTRVDRTVTRWPRVPQSQP